VKKGFIFLLFCLICGEVFAGVFTVIPTDKSQEYLGIIFGGSIGPISLGGGNNPTLSLMFERFNFIIVTIGAAVLSYIGVLVTINTAREGEAMGKKISLWVPLRAFSGMLLMVPGPTSGYSVVQMTVIWIVLNGIGAANSVWNVVLAQLAQNVGAVGALQIQMNPGNLNTLSRSVLQASTCMYAINSYMPELSANAGPMQNKSISVYTITKPPTSIPAGAPTQINQIASVFVGVQGASSPLDRLCGEFTVTSTVNRGDPINTFNFSTVEQRLRIKVAGLQSMFSALDPAAQLLANNAGNYELPDPGYVRAAGLAYISQITQLATGVKAIAGSNAQPWEAGQNPVNPINGDFEQLKSYGWIHAGSYYFTMVKATSAHMDPETVYGLAVLPAPSGVPGQSGNLNANGTLQAGAWPTDNGVGASQLTDVLSSGAPNFQLSKMSVSLNHSFSYWTTDQTTAPPPAEGFSMPAASTGNSTMDAIVNGIRTEIQAPILRYIQNIASGSANASFTGSPVDPLISIGQFGGTLMLAGEIAAFISIVTSFIISAAVSAGACVNPFAYAFNLLFVSLLPLIYSLAIIMWTLGATLGIYLPLVPYLVFTMTAFGWMISVIEAVVAAPMIALGLVQPGEGELGKIAKALGILANIFLRPTLMIFGFVLGASLLRAGIALVNFGFIPAIQQGAAVSIFSILAVLGMYVAIITAIINKSFSLILISPFSSKESGGQVSAHASCGPTA